MIAPSLTYVKWHKIELIFLATPPGRRVQFLLGKENEGLGHEPHPVFCEMEELYIHQNGEMEWRETAR